MARQSLIHSNPNSESIPIANHSVHNTLATAANLANLLPTCTVLAFQALTLSFTNNGTCKVSNQYLTATLLLLCSSICFISSFTDSFTYNGKLLYGIATFKGHYIFDEFNGEANGRQKDLSQGCFFPAGGEDLTSLTTNLPLGVGVLSSFLFTIFPTTRRGIGYSDMVPQDTSMTKG
ncbi:hypothetical protein QQ045_012150 [Rhodiola kirilowii]